MRVLMFLFLLTFTAAGCFGKTDKAALQHSFPGSGQQQIQKQVQKTESPEKQTAAVAGNKMAKILIYYANQKEDPELLKPEKTYPVSLEIQGNSDREIAQQAISKLIAGPNEQQEKEGFYTTIPQDTKLNSLTITDTAITVDFDKNLNKGGGSCEMQQRRSQIENTLRNLPSGKNKMITITVEGSGDKALQP